MCDGYSRTPQPGSAQGRGTGIPSLGPCLNEMLNVISPPESPRVVPESCCNVLPNEHRTLTLEQ